MRFWVYFFRRFLVYLFKGFGSIYLRDSISSTLHLKAQYFSHSLGFSRQLALPLFNFLVTLDSISASFSGNKRAISRASGLRTLSSFSFRLHEKGLAFLVIFLES